MKPERDMTITIHPPGRDGQERWNVWALDHFYVSYDGRTPASAMSDMIQRTLYKVLP